MNVMWPCTLMCGLGRSVGALVCGDGIFQTVSKPQESLSQTGYGVWCSSVALGMLKPHTHLGLLVKWLGLSWGH